MNRKLKTILIIIALIFSIVSISLIAICISMNSVYYGKSMGNEANGFFSVALLMTILMSVVTIVLWIVLIRKYFYKEL